MINDEWLKFHVAADLRDRLISMMPSVDDLAHRPFIAVPSTQLGVMTMWAAAIDTGHVPIFAPPYTSKDELIAVGDAVGCTRVLREHKHSTWTIEEYAEVKAGKPLTFPDFGVIHMTSATTGKRKLIYRSLPALLNEVRRFVAAVEMSASDCIFVTAPLYHSFGFCCGLLAACNVESRLVCVERVLPRATLSKASHKGATVLLGAPFVFSKFCEVARGGECRALRRSFSAGGPMLPGLPARYKAAFGSDLCQIYGASEFGSLCVSEPGDHDACVGRPLSGVTFQVATRSDVGSQLIVSSTETVGCYINDDGELEPVSATALGDAGFVDERGKLWITGRTDDVVAIGGMKVSLGVVRRLIESHPMVISAKVKLQCERDREELVALVKCTHKLDPAALKELCRRHLLDHQIPTVVIESQDPVHASILRNWKG